LAITGKSKRTTPMEAETISGVQKKKKNIIRQLTVSVWKECDLVKRGIKTNLQ